MYLSTHPTATAAQSARFELVVDTKAPRTARALATAALSDWELEEMVADVTLCFSEL